MNIPISDIEPLDILINRLPLCYQQLGKIEAKLRTCFTSHLTMLSERTCKDMDLDKFTSEDKLEKRLTYMSLEDGV